MYNSHDLAISIKKEAKDKGIAIKDMLSDLKIGSNTMSALYHGKSIAYDTLARIADYLECSIDFLLGRTNVLEEDKKISAPQNVKRTVYSFEGEEDLGTEELIFDKSIALPLSELMKSARSLSAEQINLLVTLAKNMKDQKQ